MYKLPNLSLYIHIPWCIKKCFYCDFYSITKNKNLKKKYIKEIIKDLKNDSKFIQNRTIKTIFIGGGTPSILSEKLIKFLIKKIKKNTKVSNKAEITIEINPETIKKKKIKKFIQSGINRFSIGIQTFENNLLKKIGRNHSKPIIIKALKSLKKKKINVNLDIMYGLPNQNIEQVLSDISQTIKFQPKHISWYQLSLEKNTHFYKKKINLPNDVTIIKMFKKGQKLLKYHGYKQYEISSYTKNHYQSKHNLNYWNFGDYLGIGSGGHSKITKNKKQIYRFKKSKNIIKYLNGNYIDSIKKISKKKIILEYFMNKLRILKPIKYSTIQNDIGIHINELKTRIQKLIKKKYIINNGISFKTTKNGRLFLNTLLLTFL